MKKILFTLFLVVIFISCANGDTKDNSTVIKNVGKETITENEVQSEFNKLGIKPNTDLRNSIIENLTIQKLFKQEAEKEGLSKDKNFIEEKKRNDRMLLASLYVEKNVYQKVANDDQLLKQYYEDNKKKLDFEQVKIAHIVIKNANLDDASKKEALKKAEALLERALKGENFYELARAFSQAPDAKWGGEIGYISKGDMVLQIEDVAFNNPIGIYPKIIETIYGYEIIYIIEKKGKMPEFENLSESEKNQMKDLLLNDYYNNQIKKLKKEYGVER